MAQKQTKKAEAGKEPLVCTHGKCKKLQCADGEFCKKHSQTEYDKVIDALNVVDDSGEHGNDTYEEQKARGKAYKIVADFIDKNAKRYYV